MKRYWYCIKDDVNKEYKFHLIYGEEDVAMHVRFEEFQDCFDINQFLHYKLSEMNEYLKARLFPLTRPSIRGFKL